MHSDNNIDPSKFMTQGDWRKLVHEMNNHMSIVEAFFSVVDREKFIGDERKLFNNARRSLDEMMDLVERVGV